MYMSNNDDGLSSSMYIYKCEIYHIIICICIYTVNMQKITVIATKCL